MSDQEGVIKYQLSHQSRAIEDDISITSINAWRTLLFKLELIGQLEGRYGGYAFGNISQRLTAINCENVQFIISGTQTGNIASLSRHHYCLVLDANLQQNSLRSTGCCKPSSEALTHASVYQQDNAIQSVIHIHCPEIWRNSHELELPCTAADISYGTVAMAAEVKRLFDTAPLQNTDVFSMLGHEDGIVAFSDSMEKAALLLIQLLADAIAIKQRR